MVTSDGSNLLPLYLERIARAALQDINLEELWLSSATCGPLLTTQLGGSIFTLKIRQLGGGVLVSDETMEAMSLMQLRQFVYDHLRTVRRAWSFVRRPRNYYFLNSLQFYIRHDERLNTHSLYWKMRYVVMPRSWRRKVWRARQQRERRTHDTC
jgi:hypothetical protein